MKDEIMPKVLGILTTTFTLLGINLTNIPYNSFTIIVCVCLGIIIYEGIEIYHEKKKNKTRKKLDSLIKEASQSDNSDELCQYIAGLVKHYAISTEKTNSKKRNDDAQKKRVQCIIIASIVMLVCCLFNYKNVPIFVQQIQSAVKTLTSEPEPTPVPISALTPVPIPISTPEPIQIPTPIPAPTIAPNPDLPDSETEWVKFKLEHPEGYPINQKEYEELYEATFYIGGNDLDEMMKSEITIWLNSCAVNSSGNSTSYYVNLEVRFSSETLRSSNLLDDLIDGREELMESRPNEALAWLLANHKQTYALNYLYQTDCKKSILYFYMGSIQDTRRSLEFEADGETKLDRIRYLQARYKDIADCTHIDEEDCLQALKIYVAIENALKELGLA